ncbi:MAG: hypothetical protein HC908_13145 [Calothrix sp. SM1_7_51]|nr:hypothetical protein [Calothrix sp. SM1_7_51]
MKTNRQLNHNQILECTQSLQQALEEYGVDIFCEAVIELLNYHTLTTLGNYSSKIWMLLILPEDFDPDTVVGMRNLTLTTN